MKPFMTAFIILIIVLAALLIVKFTSPKAPKKAETVMQVAKVEANSEITSAGKMRIFWHPMDGVGSYAIFAGDTQVGTFDTFITTTRDTSYTVEMRGESKFFQIKTHN